MLLTLIAFFFVLSLLVVVHEFGHYIVAKLGGIGVERFSVGYPPRLFGIKIGETDYCISAIPFGGYVKLHGQEDFAENGEYQADPRDFRSKHPVLQIAVLAAGSILNLVAAVVIFAILFLSNGVPETTNRIGYVKPDTLAAEIGLAAGDEVISVNGDAVEGVDEILLPLVMNDEVAIEIRRGGETLTLRSARSMEQDEEFGAAPYYPARVATVVEDSPASRAGLQTGDIITAIDGQTVDGWYQMSSIIRAMPDRDAEITVDRGGQAMTLPMHIDHAEEQTADGASQTIGRIGVTQKVDTRKVGVFEATTLALDNSWYLIVNTFDFLGKLVTGRMSAELLGGPVMIAQFAGESARIGFAALMSFTAFISIQLGVLNLLPIPVLDGGHIFFLVTEMVIRRRVSEKFKFALQQVGALLLLLFMLYVTFNDIMRVESISRLFGG